MKRGTIALKRDRKERNVFLKISWRILHHILFAILTMLSFACIWGMKRYSNISFDEILFYLTMPLRGTETGLIREIIKYVVLPTCIITLGRVLISWILRNCHDVHVIHVREKITGHKKVIWLYFVWTCVLLVAGNSLLDFTGYFRSIFFQSSFIETEYIDGSQVSIRFPERKRNLITIYVESAETTNQDIENGGRMDRNFIPEMTELARRNISFSQSELFEGAVVAPSCGWTMAGLVAETAGIPLKFSDPNLDNAGSKLLHFLPGAFTLGDILKKEGYHTVFLAGSVFAFGGRQAYYSEHGNYEILDYYTMMERGKYPEDYRFGWGFEDWRLYEYAQEELALLVEEGTPFHLAMMTQDTHDPGFICEFCPWYEAPFLERATQCASKQLWAFVEWCKEQPWYDNTTIVIAGDHANMNAEFYENHAAANDIHAGSVERLVYNCFISTSV